MNLLKETIDDIKKSGHNIEDISFIGSPKSGYSCTWDEFKILADREYYSGFGSQEVACDLEIIFDDGLRMWRHEYDGSECWYYSRPVTINHNHKPIKSLFSIDGDCAGWGDLDEIQVGFKP